MKLVYPFIKVKEIIIPTFIQSINMSCNENDNNAFLPGECDC